jgi:hypothetical protein
MEFPQRATLVLYDGKVEVTFDITDYSLELSADTYEVTMSDSPWREYAQRGMKVNLRGYISDRKEGLVMRKRVQPTRDHIEAVQRKQPHRSEPVSELNGYFRLHKYALSDAEIKRQCDAIRQEIGHTGTPEDWIRQANYENFIEYGKHVAEVVGDGKFRNPFYTGERGQKGFLDVDLNTRVRSKMVRDIDEGGLDDVAFINGCGTLDVKEPSCPTDTSGGFWIPPVIGPTVEDIQWAPLDWDNIKWTGWTIFKDGYKEG